MKLCQKKAQGQQVTCSMKHPGEADGLSPRAPGGAGTAGAAVHSTEAPFPLLAARNLLSTPPGVQLLSCWETRPCLKGASPVKPLGFRGGSSALPDLRRWGEQQLRGAGQCPPSCTHLQPSLLSLFYSLFQQLIHFKRTKFPSLLLAVDNPNFSRCCS